MAALTEIETRLLAPLVLQSLLLVAVAQGQHYQFDHFSARDGVPSVRTMAYDPAGLLWLGTSDGLVHYDGHEFTTLDLGRPRQPVVEHLAVAGETGWVWVLTRDLRLRRADRFGLVEQIPLPSEIVQQLKGQVSTTVHLSATGRKLFLAAGTALWQVDSLNSWTPILQDLGAEFRDMRVTADGSMYLATPGRVGRVVDRSSGQVQWLARPPQGHVVFVRPQPDGRLWVGTEHGLYLWSAEGLEEVLGTDYRCWPFADPGLRADGGLAVEIETSQPNPAMSTMVFSARGQLEREISLHNGLPTPIISSLIIDREDGLWIGSTTGVSYLEEDHPVAFYPKVPGHTQAEALQMIARHPADSTLWISTFAGVFRLDDGLMQYVDTGAPRRMASPLTISQRGDVFWQEYPFQTQFYRWDGGRVYHEPDRGMLVAEHHDGTRLFKRQRRLYLTQGSHRVALHGQVRNRVRLPATFGPDGRLWLYNGTGLDTVVGDSLASSMQAAPPRPVRAVLDKHRVSPRILDITTGVDGTVWMSVEDEGLVRLWKRSGGDWASVSYSVRDGLLSNRINSIQALPDGRMWLGTLRGVQGVRLAPDGTLDSFEELRAADGLSSEYVKDVIEDHSGALWIATDEPALMRFDRPASTLSSPATWIRSLKVNGRPQRPTAPVRVRADTARVSILLAAKTFRQNHRIRYQYRLLGLDSTWTSPSSQRSVRFAHLPPGHYTLQARAARGNGQPGPITSMALVLTPPFYQAAWFYVLCSVLGGGLLFGVYVWRLRAYRQRQHHLEGLVSERTAQLRAQADRLAELDRAKSRFFANVSHEFRTPLTLITGPLEEGLDEDPDVRERQEQLMLRNARRLLHLVEQLLDLAKLESRQLTVRPRPGDLRAFIRSLTRRFQPLAERSHVDLRFHTDLRVFPFTFDPDAIEKIVGNLLSNALKFTPEGGKVWVSLSSERPEWAEVVVKDTGPGIPEEALEHLFERFEQVEHAPQRPHEGTGLGLALAYELTELLGGQILVESEPGFGSAFTVRLPTSPCGDEPGRPQLTDERRPVPVQRDPASRREVGAAGAGTPAAGAPSSGTTLLIVDDHPEVRALIRSHLEDCYHVVEASSGREALRAARDQAPALILADVMMPDLDGVALVEALREDEQLRTIPVLLLTARAEEEDVVRGLEAGASDYLTKPFSADELRARIARHLEVHRTLRQQFSDEVVVRPTGVTVSSEEEAFIEQAVATIEEHLSEPRFGVGALAEAMNMSKRQLRRRLKDAVGEPPGALIRRLRLERAAQLLEAEAGTIAEVAFRIGYRTPSHFSKAFRDHFGHTPSAHVEKQT